MRSVPDIINKYECNTIDQELALVRRFVFTHQVAIVFCVKWRHGSHLGTVTPVKSKIRQSVRI